MIRVTSDRIAPADNVLAIWTIYDSPSDMPGKFVARKFLIEGGPEPTRTASVIIGDTADEVRGALPCGLTCLPRDPQDEPHIVESWL